MVKHVVMWRLKDSAGNRGKKENAGMMKHMLEGLKGKIREVRLLEVGLSAENPGSNYDVVLYSEFEGWKDLEAYLEHPEHTPVREFVMNVTSDRAAVDFEAE